MGICSAAWGFIAWPFALAASFCCCGSFDRAAPAAPDAVIDVAHAVLAWLATLIVAHELAWLARWNVSGGAWRLVPWGLVPALMLMVDRRVDVARRVADGHARSRVARHRRDSAGRRRRSPGRCTPTSRVRVTPAPLPFVPLVNPIDLTQGLRLRRDRAVACVACATSRRTLGAVSPEALGAVAAGAAAVLGDVRDAAYAASLGRRPVVAGAHVGVARRAGGAVARVVACSHSPRWSSPTGAVTALAWVAGAALLAVVVAKLFFVDLSQVGGVERIVSFMGVGVLLLVIGYMAPVPPRRESVMTSRCVVHAAEAPWRCCLHRSLRPRRRR